MKKGFTLIELLAVIVILAIIAVIATPIVLNIINDTKESAILRSADFYIDALENEIMLENMKQGGNFNPNICTVTNKVITCDSKEIKLKVDGEVPTSGSITFEEGKVTDVNLTYPNGTVTLNNKGELVLDDAKEEKITLVNYIKNLYTETKTTTVNNIEYSLDETHLLMNDRLGNKDVAKTDGNIRYYGASPNNYIDIGDRDSDGNIIFWRIIGLFKDVEVIDEEGNVIKTEDLVKIIRADNLTAGYVNGFTWTYNSNIDWNDATLQVLLNNAYYNSGTTNYYDGLYEREISLNFASTGLSKETHNKIERVKWNLGEGTKYSGVYADTIYGYERVGTNSWSGKVALMYPSDYGYSADLSVCKLTLDRYGADWETETCENLAWMYNSSSEWTIVTNFTLPLFVDWYGAIGSDASTYSYGVSPVLYLKADVSIVEEKETSDGLKYLVVE